MNADLDKIFDEIRLQMRRAKENNTVPQIAKYPLEYRISLSDTIQSQRYAIKMTRNAKGIVVETFVAADRPQYACEKEGSLLDALTLVEAAMILSFNHCLMGEE